MENATIDQNTNTAGQQVPVSGGSGDQSPAPVGATATQSPPQPVSDIPQPATQSGGTENYVSVADEYQIDGADPAPSDPAQTNQAPSIIAPSMSLPDATARPQSPTPSTPAPKF